MIVVLSSEPLNFLFIDIEKAKPENKDNKTYSTPLSSRLTSNCTLFVQWSLVGWIGVDWGGFQGGHPSKLYKYNVYIYIYMIKKRITPKQIMPQQIINFGANPIREGSWCVGGFVGGCGMRTIQFWSRANSTRSGTSKNHFGIDV